MRPDGVFNRKNFATLMALSVFVSLIISGAVFYFVGNATVAAAVATVLIASDYFALKLLMKE